MKHERALRALLLVAYALVFSGMFPLWELATDDGKTLMTAENYLRSPEFLGPSTSLKVLHPPYVYLFHAFFLAWGSLAWLQAGIVAAHLASHWLLIGLGRGLFSTRVAYAASLLAFTSPNFLFLYHQRFWEPVLLPLLTMLALTALLRYRREGKGSCLLLSVAAITLASGAHFAALCLLAFPALAVAARGGGRELRPLVGFGCVALALLALFPVALHLGQLHPWRLGAFGLFLAAGLALAWKAPRWAREETVLRFGLPAALLGAALYLVLNPFYTPLRTLLHLLDPYGNEAFSYNGHPAAWQWWWLVPLPVLWGAFHLARQRDPAQRLFACWVSLPLLPIFVFAPWALQVPGHWLSFLFPAAWLACMQGLFGLPWGRLGRAGAAAPVLLAAGLVAVQAHQAAGVRSHLESTGGIGMHTASLGAKVEVIERIFRESGAPSVSLLVNPWRKPWEIDLYGWAFLLRRQERLGGGEGKLSRSYYIHQPLAGFYAEGLADQLHDQPGFREERIGPVVLYSTDRLVESAGLRVPRRMGVIVEELRGPSR